MQGHSTLEQVHASMEGSSYSLEYRNIGFYDVDSMVRNNSCLASLEVRVRKHATREIQQI